MARHRNFIFPVACVAVVVFGMGGLSLPAGDNAPASIYSQDEMRQLLRVELEAFDQYLEDTMKEAERIYKKRGASRKDLSGLRDWQKLQLDQYRRALEQPDALAALLDAWAVSQSLAVYLEQGADYSSLPESARELALEMLRRRELRVVGIAGNYLPPETVKKLSERITGYAKEEGEDVVSEAVEGSGKASQVLFSLWNKGSDVVGGTVGGILSIPLMPVRAVSGLYEGGKGLSDLSSTGNRAVDVAAELPAKIRQEMEALLDRVLAEQEDLSRMLSEVTAVSSNIGFAAERTEAATANIQQTLDRARELLPEGRQLAESAEKAAAASRELVEAVDRLRTPLPEESSAVEDESPPFVITEYEAAAQAIREGAEELNRLLDAVDRLVNRPQPADEPPSESIRPEEITRAAEALTELARELRSALESGRAGEQSLVLVEASRAAGEKLVDRLFLRFVQLTGVILLAAMLYRLVARRFR